MDTLNVCPCRFRLCPKDGNIPSVNSYPTTITIYISLDRFSNDFTNQQNTLQEIENKP